MFKGNFEEVQFFTKRQIQVYGDITQEDDQIIHQLVMDFHRQQDIEEREFQSHLGRF